MHSQLRGICASFRDDERGVTAILFAAVAVPLLALGLAALDYSRAQGTQTAIQSAADTAAIAGAKMLGAPHSEIETAVRGYLRANLPKDRQDLDFVLTFASDDQSLTVQMNISVPTTILGIVGVHEMPIAVASTVQRPEPIKAIEAANRGVAPELPQGFAGFNSGRSPTLDDMRQAESGFKQMLQDMQADGGSPEVERLLRALGELR